MTIYLNRKTGSPVHAIQFTDRKSADIISKEFGCKVKYDAEKGEIDINGQIVKRGQFAVMPMFAIVPVDKDLFDSRFKPFDGQMELI